ncbi:DUF6231 family protein [Alkalilimnicola ehrlichii MLHE-1]|uniref:Class I SAM-dependent methyltransferase n=1 Tax=Alkalilimnicola ehrlichii (strain ATCC BAA-1101 / DSM 17681 / MLHE-1) TaxID=187272 RepID=Q0A8A0_ALKEH|nr:DUF6231 family protein [Alkalilimnicola ehrlichii]ABI56937.1 conserved hypothetical protein [Alkalilimnicola ehrlichii MLHE-1]
MSDQGFQVLAHALADAQPRSVLAVGPLAGEVATRLFDRETTKQIALDTGEASDALARQGVVDIAILTDTLERLDRREASGLLARLRDVYARRVVLLVAHDRCQWSGTDLTALGFSRLHDAPGAGTLYGFDIATYKTTPDWLNPDYWANPELWERHRW